MFDELVNFNVFHFILLDDIFLLLIGVVKVIEFWICIDLEFEIVADLEQNI